MRGEEVRRYVGGVLRARADEYDWDALRTVAGFAENLSAQGPSALAVRACRAAGGADEPALPAAASLHALHVAIHLVDDIIDGEERPSVDLPPGLRANLALALQCIAIEVLHDAPADVRAALMGAVAAAGLQTARGQELDARGAGGEEGYWRIVEAKTPPLFAAALRMGALLGGASPGAAEALAAAGVPIGVLIQLGDDLGDVMSEVLHPDWQRPGDNLALRFALEADHPDRDEFAALVSRVGDPDAYARAREILVHSGAFSFCVHHMREAAAQACRIVLAAPLADPVPVLEMVDTLVAPVTDLLARAGLDEGGREPALAQAPGSHGSG